MQRLAEDVLDPASEKVAIMFLNRGVSVWGQPIDPSSGTNGPEASEGLPGFERFIYERLIPMAFRVPSLPNFNMKDGQIAVVCFIPRRVACQQIAYLLFLYRCSTKLPIFCKPSVKHEGQRHTPSSSMSSCPLKIGLQKRP